MSFVTAGLTTEHTQHPLSTMDSNIANDLVSDADTDELDCESEERDSDYEEMSQHVSLSYLILLSV